MGAQIKGSLERELIKYTRCLSGDVRSHNKTGHIPTDGIAFWQGCQIIWLDVHVNTCATIYHTVKKLIFQKIDQKIICFNYFS